MDCATHSGVDSVSSCTRCERPICAACLERLDGSDYCTSCVAELRASLGGAASEAVSPPVGATPIVADTGVPLKGVAYAAVAGVLAALVWYGVVAVTDMKLGIVAIGVGWLVGRGAVLGAGAGGKQLGVVSLVIAVLAMVLGEYLMLNHAVHAYLVKERPEVVVPALLSPAVIFPIYAEAFGPMDAVFYAIGAWEAFRYPSRVRSLS